MLFHIKVCVIRHFFIYIYPSIFGSRIFFRHFNYFLRCPSRITRLICSKKHEILSKNFHQGGRSGHLYAVRTFSISTTYIVWKSFPGYQRSILLFSIKQSASNGCAYSFLQINASLASAKYGTPFFSAIPSPDFAILSSSLPDTVPK